MLKTLDKNDMNCLMFWLIVHLNVILFQKQFWLSAMGMWLPITGDLWMTWPLFKVNQTSIGNLSMSVHGRYVKLNIATPMCSTELCVVAPPDWDQALMLEALGRSLLHIVLVTERTASVHHWVGNSGPFPCRIPGASSVPCHSSSSWPSTKWRWEEFFAISW